MTGSSQIFADRAEARTFLVAWALFLVFFALAPFLPVRRPVSWLVFGILLPLPVLVITVLGRRVATRLYGSAAFWDQVRIQHILHPMNRAAVEQALARAGLDPERWMKLRVLMLGLPLITWLYLVVIFVTQTR